MTEEMMSFVDRYDDSGKICSESTITKENTKMYERPLSKTVLPIYKK